MEVLTQNLIQEFTAIVFEKDELEFRDKPELKSILPVMAYQDQFPCRDHIICLELTSLLQVLNHRD